MASGDVEKRHSKEEVTLEDGGIEESPHGSFDDGEGSEEEDDDDEPAATEDEDEDEGDGPPLSFLSHQWPQSYRCALRRFNLCSIVLEWPSIHLC
jgi:hypothetical protein